MHRQIKSVYIISLLLILSIFLMSNLSAQESAVERGKKVAFDRQLGNCLACHMIEDGEAPGNIGPPLVAMKARFPDSEKLRNIIWDITQTRPEAMMPPFGKHKIISEQEIDDVVTYLYTL